MSEGEVYIYNGVDEVPEDITHVRVDSSVTVIPMNAFTSRRQLEEIELPEGLIRIGNRAFQNCTSLRSINFPSTVVEIGNNAFYNCTKLDGISLPEGLQRLGKYAIYYCDSLKSINIPPNLENINVGAFLHCHSLSSVHFSEGIIEIKTNAFCYCNSLVSISLPSSLRDIGKESFEECPSLNEIHIPDTIESIEARAFKNCNFTNFRIPPLISEVIDVSIVGRNTCLVSLELPETVQQLEDKYDTTEEQYTDLNVRNIAVPSNCEIDIDLLEICADLGIAFSADTDDRDVTHTTISNALKQRFDNLPIHKICYYQSYHDTETSMQNLKREINPWTSKFTGQLNKTGKQQDCLGMTPLHILACSTKQNIDTYRLLIEKYPETLIMKDKWGDIPLLYVFWCNASTEALDLLVESYKSLQPDYEFDWKGMLLSLAKRDVPLANIQNLFNTQHKISPDYNYNMQGIVLELASSNAIQASLRKPYTSIETFKYLLRVSITKRLDLLSVSKWREDLGDIINVLPDKANYRNEEVKNREEYIKGLYDKLATYELIKEGTSILELALWKYKIDESRNKKARVDEDVSYKEQCRISCGADIIIGNVLPYLIPKPYFIRKTKF